MQRILLIGANSQLAIRFLKLQALSNIDVYRTNIASQDEAAKIYKLDLSEGVSEHALKEIDFDVAIVFAAKTNIAECERNPTLAFTINCDSVTRLIATFRVRQWILFSTNAVFSGRTELESKNASYGPLSVYGSSKVAMEKAVSGVKDVAVVRMTKVITHNFSLLDSFIEKLKNKQAIEVFSDLRFSPIWIDDVCHFLNNLVTDFHAGVFHLSANRDISYYDAVRYCAEQLNLCSKDIKSVKKPFVAPDFNSLEVGAAEYKLGFPAVSPEQILDKYLLSQ